MTQQAVQNKVLSEMPVLASEVYAPAMPEWFATLLRLISLGFSLLIAWAMYQHWATTPAWAKVLLSILGPATLYSALNASGWNKYSGTPYFLADKLGMYFRHKDAFITHLGKDAEEKNQLRNSWLFVPWANIANIHVSKVSTHQGSFNGAVLNVMASLTDLEDFFAHSRIGQVVQPDGSVRVAFYMHVPPTSQQVVSTLQQMMHQYKGNTK